MYRFDWTSVNLGLDIVRVLNQGRAYLMY